MLSRYSRWASENHRLESLETLRDWITEESEYQVKAMEGIEGLRAKAKRKEDRRKNRTFTTFRGRRKEAFAFQRKCYLCQGNHGIWSCQQFKDANVDERWRIAKDKRLCFRCYVTVTKGRTASEREHVEKTAAERVITNYFILLKNVETEKFLLTLKVYQIFPHHLQEP